jgi:hypothetical protein
MMYNNCSSQNVYKLVNQPSVHLSVLWRLFLKTGGSLRVFEKPHNQRFVNPENFWKKKNQMQTWCLCYFQIFEKLDSEVIFKNQVTAQEGLWPFGLFRSN